MILRTTIGSKGAIMYIIKAVGKVAQRRREYYLVKVNKPDAKRKYRWVVGADGLQAAARFVSQDAAGVVALAHPEHYQAIGRIVWDPMSDRAEPPLRRRGFVIRAIGNGEFSYVVLVNGVFRWQHGSGPSTAQQAFRFGSTTIAIQMMQAGFQQAKGRTAEVVQM